MAAFGYLSIHDCHSGGGAPGALPDARGQKQLSVPWAEPGSQFTALFERLATDLLRECAVTGAAKVLRISWAEAWGIKRRAVARGVARRREAPLVHLGVDEKAIAKGHRYLTVVADLDRHQVLYLAGKGKGDILHFRSRR